MNAMDLAQQAGSHPWAFLVAALALGALHGLEPGHSKGIMTAFMIGTRGTYAQAVVLAVCATLSHTAVVWILAVPASFGGAWWSDVPIAPYLNLISGIVVLTLAWWMLRRFNRARHGHGHDHDHDHGHHHHEHDHSHTHANEPGAGPALATHGHTHDHDHSQHDHHHHHDEHGHAHAPEGDALAAVLEDEDDAHARYHMREVAERFSGQAVSTAQVAVFGLTTGLAPCSAAIVILITCFRLHEPWLGLALVGAFSVGLGLTLTAVALAAAWGLRVVGARSKTFAALAENAPFLSALVTAAIGIYLIVQFFRS